MKKCYYNPFSFIMLLLIVVLTYFIFEFINNKQEGFVNKLPKTFRKQKRKVIEKIQNMRKNIKTTLKKQIDNML